MTATGLIQRQTGDDRLQIVAVLDRLAGQRRDDIAVLHARLVGRRILEHLRHEHALVLVQTQARGHVVIEILDLHAEIAAMHHAVLEQLLHDVLGHVGGDGQADALEAAAAALDRRVDADHLAVAG